MDPVFLIAWLALVVAGLDAIGVLLLALSQNRFNRRLADIEQMRRAEEVAGRDVADVRVRTEPTGSGTFMRPESPRI